jgi:hypothetical protein
VDTFASALIQLIPRFYSEQGYRTGSGPGQYGNSSRQTLERALHATLLASLYQGFPAADVSSSEEESWQASEAEIYNNNIDAARSNAPDRFLGNNDYT